jgi:hypothetical protein
LKENDLRYDYIQIIGKSEVRILIVSMFTKGGYLSLFFQHIVELYSHAEYNNVREELQNFEKANKPFPECIYRELDYAVSNTYRKIREENVFPIRFLWLFELKEQVMTGVSMPLDRSHYNPEFLYARWLKCLEDESFRQEAIKEAVLFDLDNKALTWGWVLIGDTFIDDLMEIEAFYGEELMVPDKETGISSPLFVNYKSKKMWLNGAIRAVRCESKMKPRKCPACCSPRIAEILYGMPEISAKLEKDLSAGRIILGGCCISDDDPEWQCADCQMVIYKKSLAPR